jgi:hypothetical protein
MPTEFTQVIDIAEESIKQIATYLFEKNLTMKLAYKDVIYDEHVDGEQKEIINRDDFIRVTNSFDIGLNNIELECMSRLLGKHQVGGAMFTDELSIVF